MGEKDLEDARERYELLRRGLTSSEKAKLAGSGYTAEQLAKEMKAMLQAAAERRAEARKRLDDAFGIWRAQPLDGQDHQEALRQEWVNLTGHSSPPAD